MKGGKQEKDKKRKEGGREMRSELREEGRSNKRRRRVW